jgi:hypothetical protein
MAGHLFAGLDTRLENPAGLAGVWAEENTRESIFEAMQRKETFAVSGPHIKLHFFGGWEYKADDLSDKDWVKTGYKKGVPMGGDLKSEHAEAPTFRSKAGQRVARVSRRFLMWCGRVIASRTSGLGESGPCLVCRVLLILNATLNYPSKYRSPVACGL